MGQVLSECIMEPMLRFLQTHVQEAAKIILQSYDRIDRISIANKAEEQGRYDFVTSVDQQVEASLVEAIAQSFPRDTILSEEAGLINEAAESTRRWIIDPLDGTTNFIRGIPYFAISVAIEEDGELRHAMVYDPMHDELFTASRGHGAWRNNTRMRINQHRLLSESLLGTCCLHHRLEQDKRPISAVKSVLREVMGVRRMGAAALDLAYVAAGRLDVYWESALKPWDCAAGVLLVQEAGGVISDGRGGEVDLEAGHVLAASPALHQKLSTLMADGATD